MAIEHPKYQKDLADFSIDYDPAKAYYVKHRPFIFQVSLGDLDLNDAFWVELGPEYVNFRLGEFLDIAFPRSKRQQTKISSLLDTKENPDLPDMYVALLEMVSEWREGKCSLEFFINQGPEIKLTDRLDDHLSLMQSPEHRISETALLDLVIDQKLDVMDYLSNEGYIKNKQTTIEFMQANILMYFLDKLKYRIPVAPIDDIDKNLSPIARKLQSANLIEPSDLEPVFEISEEGKLAIGKTIGETESYIDQYDIFKDVLFDANTGSLEFGTGRGKDLRVQVYDAEDLDSVRVVFLLQLYDSTIDNLSHDWRESILSEELFGEILSPIMNAEYADDDIFQMILGAGFNSNERRTEANMNEVSQQEIIDRLNKP